MTDTLEDLGGLTPHAGRQAATGRGASFQESTVLARCRRELARFKVPRRIVVLEEFPMSRGANGNKIQDTVLRGMAATALEEGAPR